PAAVRLKGVLKADALEQSFREIVRRHEVLRTTFRMVNGRPVQVIAPIPSDVTQSEGIFKIPTIDLQHLAESEREDEAMRLASEEAKRPFDLAQGPLLRAQLLRLNETEHVLLLNMHHIISDGWSIGVLIKETAALYEAFLNDKPTPLAELPIQY